MGIVDSSTAENIARAAEIERHHWAMFIINLFWTLAGAAILSGFVVWQVLTLSDENASDLYFVQRYTVAKFLDGTNFAPVQNKKIELKLPSGEVKMLTPSGVIYVLHDQIFESGLPLIRSALWWWIIGSVGITVGAMYWLAKRGGKLKEDKYLRGAVIVPDAELTKRLKSEQRDSEITIGGVPTLRNGEMLNFLIAGSQGTGKSVTIAEMLSAIRNSKKPRKGIIYDPAGEFAEKFYRAGKDHILNPLDRRGERWSLFHEAKSEWDWETIAAAMVAEDKNNPYFANSARIVFAETAKKLQRIGEATLDKLLFYLVIATQEELFGFLKGTLAGPLTDPASKETAVDVRSTLTQNIRSLHTLARFLDTGNQAFSIRDWVEDDDDDSWVFITARKDMLDALRPVITAFLAVATTGVLCKPVVREVKVWFFMDEVANLNKLPQLGILLSEGRKHGAAVVLGIQNVAQLREIYGNDLTEALTSVCQTWLVFRTKNYETCKFLSDNLGKEEIEEKDNSKSYGAPENRDGINLNSKRIEKALVMPDEIRKLPTFEAFLDLPEDLPLARIRVAFQDLPTIAEPFILRHGATVIIPTAPTEPQPVDAEDDFIL